MPDPTDPRQRPIFYGRRRGKRLRKGAAALLDSLLPRIRVPMPEPGRALDPRALFDAPVRAVWLEIGFGAGEHLAAQAVANPDVGLIGAEVYVNGVAKLLRHIERGGIGNIRVYHGDVRLLLPALPDASLERVFLLFPDPWPKKRHAERRFVNPGNLAELARLLADGGELRIASDDPTYQEWTLEQMPAAPVFEPVEQTTRRPDDWPQTRYEAKAAREGRQSLFLRYRRRPRAAAAEGTKGL